MQATTFRLRMNDGVEVFVHRFEPASAPKAVVQISHGMAEHGARYARLAEQLTAAGYALYVNDHRGHGHTAPTAAELGYFADHDGFVRLVEDLYGVNRRIAADHPGLPIYLLGHSMGSFVVQYYLTTHASSIAGAILSGSATGGGLAGFGRLVSALEKRRIGPRGISKFIHATAFAGFNLGLKPRRTDVDWLSRDSAEVDKYVADPLCGFPITVQAWSDFFGGLLEIVKPERIAKVPQALPLYIFSGGADPVGGRTRLVRALIRQYERAGLTDITQRFYPDARHETLNETNRDEVTRDLIAWLDAAYARRAEH